MRIQFAQYRNTKQENVNTEGNFVEQSTTVI